MNSINHECALVSVTYNANGHSREYIDNLLHSDPHNKCLRVFVPCTGIELSDSRVVPVRVPTWLIKDYSNSIFNARVWLVLYRFLMSIIFFARLSRRIGKFKKVIFVDYEYFSLILSLPFFKRKNIPISILIHNPKISGSLLKRAYKRISLFFISCYKNVSFYVNNSAAVQDLKLFVDQEVTCVPYPAVRYGNRTKENSKSALGLNSKLVFSMIGMIRPDKNYEEAISAFAESKLSKDDRFSILIAGARSGVSANFISTLLSSYEITNAVLIEKYLSQEELDVVFSASDLLLIPYGDKNAASSGPVSTAREYDLPVLCRNGRSIGDYVSDYSVGKTYSTHDELVSFFDHVSRDPNIIRFPDRNFATARQDFSWANAAEIILSGGRS